MDKLKYGKYYKVKKRRAILKNRNFWLLLGIIFIISGSLYLVLFSSAFKVKKITIIGQTNYASRLEIETEIYKKIFKPDLFYLSSNIFLLKESLFKENILKDFLSLKDLKMKKKMPDGLVFEIIERKPISNYCPEEKCFLVDDEGYIFAESDRSLVFLESGDNKKGIGDFCLDKNLWKKAQNIMANLKEELKIKSNRVSIFPLRIEIQTDQNWILIFSPQKDEDRQLQELKIILGKQITEENQNQIEYIDLRYDKVFYKLRGD